MSVEINNEDSIVGAANESELDLYGDSENFDHLNSGQEKNNTVLTEPSMDHNIKLESRDENDDDLYNAVITERSSPNGDSTGGLLGASGTHSTVHITGSGTQQRKYSCYVGNLTWWTTDQDLVDNILAVNINDLIDVKFYENRQNGQSKGFALVSFNSEVSVRQCTERLTTRQVHGQNVVVLPYTKHSLSQFEAATRKPGERPPNQQNSMKVGMDVGKPGGPVFIGTFRIGTAPPPSPAAPPITHVVRPAVIVRPAPMPAPMGPPGMSGPPHFGTPSRPPHSVPPVLIPPPAPNRPPPGFPHASQPIRIGMPPPSSGMMPHVMPPPGSHVNPNFYPNIAAAAASNLPSSGGGGGGSGNDQPLSEAEFEEIMNRNRTVSSSAISRAVSDASAGDFASAIETLVTAISLIRQSKVAHDDRCKILISSLQDTLRGIEAKSFGGAGGGSGSGARRASKERDRRSRSRERSKRRRDRTRSRSRSRDRFDEYSPRRRRY